MIIEKFEDIKPSWYSCESVFDNPTSCEVFKSYLVKIKNMTNFEFLKEVEEYKTLHSKYYLEQKAKKLIEEFIKQSSQKELNLSSETRQKIMKDFKASLETTFDQALFLPAYQSVWLDLTFDTFPKFTLDESFYKFMKGEFEKKGKKEFVRMYLLNESRVKEIESLKNIYEEHLQHETKEDSLTVTSNENLTNGFTANLEFTDQELDELKAFGTFTKDSLEKIVKEMMKPLTGVQIIIPKTGFFGKKEIRPNKREVKGISVKNWLESHLHTDNYNLITKIIHILLKKNILINLNPKMKEFDEKQIYKFGIKRRLVILGSGFSGMVVARALKDDLEVVCIDKKLNLQYKYSFHHLFSNPTRINQLEIPYSKILQGCSFICDEVLHVSPKGVFLKDRTINFDYLVIATGSQYVIPFPVEMEPPKYGIEKKNAKIVNMYSPYDIISAYGELYCAKKVVIVGAGPSAIEVATEIATYYPTINVVMISQYLTLLERKSKQIQKEVYKNLQKFNNLNILFNRKVLKIKNREIFYKINGKIDESRDESMEADVIVICCGFKANTKICRKYMSDSLSPSGYIMVNQYFQVRYTGNCLTNEEINNKIELYYEKDEMEIYEKITKKDSIISISSECSSPSLKSEKEVSEADIMNALKNDEISEDDEYSSDSDSETPSVKEKKPQEKFYPNIFSIGDVAETFEEKLAYNAIEHAKKLVTNIREMEYPLGTEIHLSKYKFGKEGKNVICMGKQGILIQGQKVLKTGQVANNAKEMIEKAFYLKFQ